VRVPASLSGNKMSAQTWPVQPPAQWRHLGAESSRPATPRLVSDSWSVPCLGLASWLWLSSLAQIDPLKMTDFGLLSILPPSFYCSLSILTLSFVIAVSRPRLCAWALLCHVILLILIIHATPPLLYTTIRYSWAWKHVGMVDYITRNSTVDPFISNMAAYHNWPGFFALSAMLVEQLGLKDAIPIALWSQPLFNLLDFPALMVLFRALTSSRRTAWLALWVFYLTNWVGQDYFAPQALAFFFYLVVIGICLTWFRSPIGSGDGAARPRPWLPGRWLAYLCQRAAQIEPPDAPAGMAQLVGLVVILLLCMTAIVASHQLTPFVLTGALAALVALGRCRLTALPLLLGVMTGAWLCFPALPFFAASVVHSLLDSFGALVDNTTSSLHDLSKASYGQSVVARIGRLFTVAVWGLAALGAVTRLCVGRVDLTLAILALLPFGLLVGNSYDGEMLFRVYLFSLPFMACSIAKLLRPMLEWQRRWSVAGTSLFSAVLTSGLLFAYYGHDHQYYFTPDEVAASAVIYGNARPGSLLVSGSRNFPKLYKNYDSFTFVPLSTEPPESQARVIADPVNELASWLDHPGYAQAFVLITRSQMVMADELGDEMPPGSLQKIEQALRRSPLFKLYYDGRDAHVFMLAGKPQAQGRP